MGSETQEDGLIERDDGTKGCFWHGELEDYRRYHDEEWARPVDNDFRLFEKLCLEGFQSGLSWLTILRKRENFREAFAGFDYNKVAQFDEDDVERLLGNAGIVRHRGKIEASINNAKRAIDLAAEHGSLARYFWSYEPTPAERPQKITRDVLMTLAKTDKSTALSKDLKKRGWRFVGPTTVYAFMQAMGMVNDHLEGCTTRQICERARADFKRP